jgi:hypothetical protein
MTVKKSENRRGRYLINPAFQIKFIVYNLAVVIISLSVVYFANSYFFYKIRLYGDKFNLPNDHIFFSLLKDQNSIMNEIFAVSVAVIIVLYFLFGVLLGHRIAGPMFKLKQFFEQLNAGDPKETEIHFRKNDFFNEVTAPINEYLNKNNK